MADEVADVGLAPVHDLHEGALAPLDVPPVRQPGGDAADLGGDELHLVVVELLAQPEPGALTLVEAGRDDPAAAPHGADGLLQTVVAAAQLDRGVGALDPLARELG